MWKKRKGWVKYGIYITGELRGLKTSSIRKTAERSFIFKMDNLNYDVSFQKVPK